ncbi:hypothetical protein [Actinophytocola sp. KF-1]
MTWADHDSANEFGMLTERLSHVALDVSVALGDTEGVARVRLERAVTGLDQTIKDMRLLATGQLRLDGGPAGGKG